MINNLLTIFKGFLTKIRFNNLKFTSGDIKDSYVNYLIKTLQSCQKLYFCAIYKSIFSAT